MNEEQYTKVDSAKSLECLINDVYQSLGGEDSKYAESFRPILGGCTVWPPTEWYGDTYRLFQILLSDKAVSNELYLNAIMEVVKTLSSYFD